MKALTLKESPFPTAKRMEYYYRIEDDTNLILCAWHSDRKMTRMDKPFVKHDKHGYLKTNNKDEAIGEVSKVVWSDGTESTVIDGIIQADVDETNVLIANEREYK